MGYIAAPPPQALIDAAVASAYRNLEGRNVISADPRDMPRNADGQAIGTINPMSGQVEVTRTVSKSSSQRRLPSVKDMQIRALENGWGQLDQYSPAQRRQLAESLKRRG